MPRGASLSLFCLKASGLKAEGVVPFGPLRGPFGASHYVLPQRGTKENRRGAKQGTIGEANSLLALWAYIALAPSGQRELSALWAIYARRATNIKPFLNKETGY